MLVYQARLYHTVQGVGEEHMLVYQARLYHTVQGVGEEHMLVYQARLYPHSAGSWGGAHASLSS